MRKAPGVAAAAALVLLFLIANRGAYQGYFSSDELDNLSWTGNLPLAEYARALLTPAYLVHNFRPVGHFTFRELGALAGLRFPWYVAFIHLLHLINTALVFRLLRRLDFGLWAASAGTLFIVFHMAVFDALWKPMFLFDLYCSLFCLLSLLAWLHPDHRLRAWTLSFLFFWLACKSKEHAIMLPAVLACSEYWLGQRRWKQLLPFFLVSLSFGVQGLLANRQEASDYKLELTAAALWHTCWFYLSRVTLYPWGALLLLIPAFIRDRRAWFGAAAAALMMVPLLVLPNRLNGAYLYASLAFVAIVFASAAEAVPWPATAAVLALWLPVNYAEMREGRKAALTAAATNHAYVRQLEQLQAAQPTIGRFVYDGNPPELQSWGIQGALRILFHNPGVELRPVEEQSAAAFFDQGPAALLSWDLSRQAVTTVVHRPGDPDAPYLKMQSPMPVWQLEQGWYPLEAGYRWSQPIAKARLHRPLGAARFGLAVNISPQYIQQAGASKVHILLDGVEIGTAAYTVNGWQDRHFDLAPKSSEGSSEGVAHIELRTEPPFHPSAGDARTFGVAVAGFGFLPGPAPSF